MLKNIPTIRSKFKACLPKPWQRQVQSPTPDKPGNPKSQFVMPWSQIPTTGSQWQHPLLVYLAIHSVRKEIRTSVMSRQPDGVIWFCYTRDGVALVPGYGYVTPAFPGRAGFQGY